MKHGMKFVALSILALVMTGCTTVPKVGDGKLEPVTMGAAKAALTAGSIVTVQGVSRIIIPTSATGLASGTLWNE